jgi:SPP1 gp7 family putative phage head morphogenesis protein
MNRDTKKIKGEEYDTRIASQLYEIEDNLYTVVSKKLTQVSEKIINWAEKNKEINKSVDEDLEELLKDEDFFIDLKVLLLPTVQIAIDYQLQLLQDKLIENATDLKTISELFDIDFNLKPQFVEFIGKREKYLAKTLKQTTIDRINDVIKAGIEDGLPFDEIAKQIQLSTGLNGYRAELIARTETNWAMNEGTRQYLKSIGVKEYEISVARDGCPICQEKAKRTYKINEKVLPIHPACRCVMTSVIPKEWLKEDTIDKAIKKIHPLLLSKSEITEEIAQKILNNEKITNIINYIPPKPINGKDAIVDYDLIINKSLEELTARYLQDKTIIANQNQELKDKLIEDIEKTKNEVKEFLQKQSTRKIIKAEKPSDVEIEKIVSKLLADYLNKNKEIPANVVVNNNANWGKIKGNIENQKDLIEYIGNYQPLENQRLSTTDDVEFQSVKTDKTIYNTDFVANGEETGTLFWNSVDGTLDAKLLGDVVLQIGQELHFYGKAQGNINNGELVQFAGVQGDHILIKKAVASEIIANPEYLVGIATDSISNGAFGYVTWFGKINNVSTHTWNVGDILYFDNTTGQLTNIEPNYQDLKYIICAVIKTSTGSAENGILIVRPQIFNGKTHYVEVSINYQMLKTDDIVKILNSGITITLPTAIGLKGKRITIDNASNGICFINTVLSQTIQGELIQEIDKDSSYLLYSDGENWRAT